jgi:hypothetical protein
MSASSKIWCLGVVVSINAMLTPSLAYTWLSIYWQYSYPIDFFLPIERTQMRAILSLCVAAISVPIALVIYARNAHELPILIRITTLVVTCVTAFTAIAFVSWRYIR